MSREEHKDAIEVSVIFHEGQRMFAVPKQPAQQEPVAQCTESDSWNCKYCRKTELCKALQDPRNFASPQPAQRKPLTDEQIADIATSHPLTWVNLNTVEHRRYFARAIEAAHGIKENT